MDVTVTCVLPLTCGRPLRGPQLDGACWTALCRAGPLASSARPAKIRKTTERISDGKNDANATATATATATAACTPAGAVGSSFPASPSSSGRAAEPPGSLSSAPAPATDPNVGIVASGTQAFEETVWVAVDPKTGDWRAGFGSQAQPPLNVGKGHANPGRGGVAFVRRRGDAPPTVGLVGPRFPQVEHPAPLDARRLDVAGDVPGGRLFVHASEPGRDAGVVALHMASGEVTTLVEPGPLPEDDARNSIFLSPSGDTLVSTVCNAERCLVDVVDTESLAARRLDEPFNTATGTDAYLLGSGHEWSSFDLAAGTSQPLDFDPAVLSRAVSWVDDARILVEDGTAKSLQVVELDLASGASRLVFESSKRALRLMSLPAVDERWVFLSPDFAFSDSLARDGTYPIVRALDLETGTVENGAIQIQDGS